MADRPAQICQLQKGQLIDTQQGFVDTFNWAVSSIANLKGGQNVEVNWELPDHPTIDAITDNNEDGGGGGGGGGGEDDPSESGISETKSVCVEIQYDTTNHKLQAKYATVVFENGVVTDWTEDSQWTDIFQAEPHQPEIS